MKAVLTRVTSARVTVGGTLAGAIAAPETGGVLALIGVSRDDDDRDCEVMARKIAELRLLDGERSATDLQAPILAVSQFTLLGRTAKGRRPSWSHAASGDHARDLFERVITLLRERGLDVETGIFGEMMQVESINDGPFTLLVDTQDPSS
ncbi:D-aminoacyl-tRNA deacylase [Corynebacterium uberis]|uniref:D-aminoacyl-tRNA deacylase n=1 Tax=Corynebacterium TaxID=1716 RepID=UPI001D0B72D0|nr:MULTISPECIES: D-aminoacyl-tRNA deacylase [Corynebacterium]MCZ9308510.1 D-aminoacyl-tRNA deacylase [Corynebacterium sp. c6VSa_13]UDL74166.1 D-tyrosyl-tRNA(Tyr) deacylase [Corynebacterium uberis]UDL74950.1 D-tyrosyl-tRNA(Tyr) deacylase [Corynebacterium uberis]UDL77165.1 D-tyrosyl-tRNA(Tyr) deacylase [Corynebacterium uberis]UDL79447.1 D-tyrosyl-tRNA(Tyr) deacylase [Corynebacterium uberis]